MPGPGLDDVTHDHVVDLVTGDTGPSQRLANGDAAQVHPKALERSGELADRRPCAADDDGSWHDKTSWLLLDLLACAENGDQVGLISIRG